jgi:hypothetical protein
MAQAPGGEGGGGGGAPRQNKTVKDFKGMNTQNKRNAVPEGQFAWLENIQPIGPGHLHSIPGRSGSVVEIPPSGDCAPGQQANMQYERRFAQNRGLDSPPIGNLHVSWAHISPTEQLYMYSGDPITDGGNMSYNNPIQVLEHFVGPYPLGNPPIGTVAKVPSPIGNYGTSNCRPGHADEPMYGSASGGGDIFYRVNGALSIDVTSTLPGGASSGFGAWAKEGSELFAGPQDGQGWFSKFDMGGALLLSDNSVLNVSGQFANDLCLTKNFVYVLISKSAGPKHQFILKFSRSNIAAPVDTLELNEVSAGLIFAINDNLIFIGAMKENTFDDDSHRLYYWDGQERWVGVATPKSPFTGTGLTPFGYDTSRVLTFGSGLAEQRYFYWGNMGVAGFDTDVWRMGPMLCTVPPLHPTVSGPGTGTIGGSVTMTWAGILEPKNTITPSQGDYVVLIPVANVFSYAASDGITVQRQYTAGLAGGTMSFAIPGTMTAGDYRIWLGGRNTNILLAKGNVIALS